MSSRLPLKKFIQLIAFSYRLGISSIFGYTDRISRNELFRFRLHRFFSPLDYLRYAELTIAANEIGDLSEDMVILDLSSPKFLSYYLASKYPSAVIATDLLNEFIPEAEYVSKLLSLNEKYTTMLCDGRHLNIPSNYFDIVYSISVIEHIPDDGDIKTVAELLRVLKPGGSLILTVPCRPSYEEQYFDRAIYDRTYDGKEPVFWTRFYDEKTLSERILQVSNNFTVEKLLFINENTRYWDWFCSIRSRFLQSMQMPIWPIFSYSFLEATEEFGDIKRLGIAVIHLKKTNA